MAQISTIFGPNESSWRHLFQEKKSQEQNERKVFEKFENFTKTENFFEKVIRMIFGSLYYSPRFMRKTTVSDSPSPGVTAAPPVELEATSSMICCSLCCKDTG